MKMLKMLRKKAGFVTIELLCIAGMMIGLGTTCISNLYDVGANTLKVAVENVISIDIIDSNN